MSSTISHCMIGIFKTVFNTGVLTFKPSRLNKLKGEAFPIRIEMVVPNGPSDMNTS